MIKKNISGSSTIALLLVIAMLAGASAATADVTIADWYPQGADYVFVCAQDVDAVTYSWTFGDGTSVSNLADNTVYHTFIAEGTYDVRCTAAGVDETAVGSMSVTVDLDGETPPPPGEADLELLVDAIDGGYALTCEAEGFTPQTYDWEFRHYGTDEVISFYDVDYSSTTFFPEMDGTWELSCAGWSPGMTSHDFELVTFNDGVTPPPPTGDDEMDLRIAAWYPQGDDYVFVCEAVGWTPDTYSWWFGDGDKQLDMDGDDVFHTYTSEGVYEVECQASAGGTTMSDTLTVEVGDVMPPPTGEDGLELRVADWYPQGNDYVFVCDADGWDPASYSWWFGDGQELSGMSSDDVYHTFAEGTYTVTCEATMGAQTMTDTLEVTIGDAVIPPPVDNGTNDTEEVGADLLIADYFPQGNDYVFICEDIGFDATSYDFWFDDGEKLMGQSSSSVWHTYADNGTYHVLCVARNDANEEMAGMILVVGSDPEPASVEAGFVVVGLVDRVIDVMTEFNVTSSVVDNGAIAMDAPLRYEAVLVVDSVPVSGQEVEYWNGTAWVSIGTTDGNGSIFFGPPSGFTLNDVDLFTGVTTRFRTTFAEEGQYEMDLRLLDVDAAATLYEETLVFDVFGVPA